MGATEGVLLWWLVSTAVTFTVFLLIDRWVTRRPPVPLMRVETLELGPQDVLVLESARTLRDEDVARIRNAIEAMLAADKPRVIVVEPGLRLAVHIKRSGAGLESKVGQ